MSKVFRLYSVVHFTPNQSTNCTTFSAIAYNNNYSADSAANDRAGDRRVVDDSVISAQIPLAEGEIARYRRVFKIEIVAFNTRKQEKPYDTALFTRIRNNHNAFAPRRHNVHSIKSDI